MTRLGLIAGNGKFPFLVLDAAQAQGYEVVVAAIKEEAFPEIESKGAASVHWLSLGELSKLIDTFKADGEILHAIDPSTAPPEPGTDVEARIDWDRRHRMMRTHTALHSLSGIIFTDYGAKVTGGNMGDDGSARMDFELERFMHLFAMNRGILLTPFHNMALMSPATTAAHVDRHTEVFQQAVQALVN